MDKTKIDIGCGWNKKKDYTGVDIHGYDDVDIVMDVRFKRLPFNDDTVTNVYASHFLEHLTFEENLFLFNEVYRVMKVGGKFEIIVPHGFSYAGMVDLSHKTFWTEDTFGYFTPENTYYYDWRYNFEGGEHKIINKWKVLKNDTTPPTLYTVDGWLTPKLREVHAYLQKLPYEADSSNTDTK